MSVSVGDDLNVTAPAHPGRKSGDGATRAPRRGGRAGRGNGAPQGRSTAAQRAYERRTQRTGSGRRADRAPHERKPRVLARRVPFVALIIGLLSVGMGLTLWLTTTSAEQSYELSAQNSANQNLQEHKATLEKAVAAGNSAPVLAQKATALGMVPTTNVARIVVGTDGVARVEGKPAAATGPAAPPLNRPEGSAPVVIVPKPAPVPGRPAAAQPGPTGLPVVAAPAAPAPAATAPAPAVPAPAAPAAAVPPAPAAAPAAPAPAAPAPAAPAPDAPAARQGDGPAPAPAQGEQSVPVNTLPPVLTGPLATGQP